MKNTIHTAYNTYGFINARIIFMTNTLIFIIFFLVLFWFLKNSFGTKEDQHHKKNQDDPKKIIDMEEDKNGVFKQKK